MGKVLTDEDIKLNIIINGNEAQKELNDLEKTTRKLTEENKGLLLQKKLLEKQGKKNTEEYKHLTAAIKENGLAIAQNKTKMSDLQKQIGITGLTMTQLTQRAHTLRMSLLNAVPGGEAFQRYSTELQQVNARLAELRGNATTAGFSIGSLADRFNRYAALGASFLGFLAGMVVSVQKIIDLNGKLSDAQANVMKTTGMTKDEVDELTKSFGILKTRTGRIELLGIAEVSGRLGIAKTEINDFVKVMDKAGVALGDSFEGGPEVVADKLGKIKGLYDDLKNASVETAFESVGSALNDLGASGTASEQNVAEFVTRVGAMPEAFKPAIGTALGLGAAFEESGLKAELAAGNYSKVISIAANNAAGFAQVMGKSKKEVEDLLKTNPNEFFLQFAESLKGMNAIDLAKTLDALKLNDNEVKMVLGAASKNTDLFREKIELANKSLLDGTSLTREFDIKNNNLAATLEKIKKTVSGWFSSEGFVAFLQSAVNWFAKFIGATEDADGNISAFKNTLVFTAKVIAIVTAAFVTNVAWQKLVVAWTNRNTQATVLYNIASKARAVADAIALIATQAFATGQMLLTGNIAGATQALRVMNTVFKTTPWGFILGAVVAIAVAYQAFKEEVDSVSKVQQTLNDVHLEAEKSIISQKNEIQNLAKVARDEARSQDERKKALLQLNEIIPDHIGLLTLENLKTMEGKSILDAYTESIYKNARAKAAQAKFDELAKQKLDIEGQTGAKTDDSFLAGVDRFLGSSPEEFEKFKTKEDISNYIFKNYSDQIDLRKQGNKNVFNKEAFRRFFDKIYVASGIREKYNKIADIDAQMKALETEVLDATVNNNSNNTNNFTPIGNPTITPKPEKKYDDSYLADEKKRKEELYQAEKKAEEDRIALLQDGYNKEFRLEILRHQDKLHQYTLTNDNLLELEKKLEKDLLAAQKAGDNTKVNSIKNQLGYIKDERVFINKQIESAEQLHHLKIGTIQEKAGLDEVEKLKDNYEKEKLVRETAFLNELNTLNLSEEEKAKRKKQFDADESKRLEETFNNQIILLENMINDVDFSGIDFSLLTPEKEAELKDKIEKLQNALAKIKEAKDGIVGNSDKEISLGLGTQTDILGFSQEQWNNFYKNIDSGKIGIETMAFAVFSLKNAFVEVDKLVAQSEAVKLKNYQKDADTRKKTLKRQLDAGIITQDQYNKRVEKIDEDLDNKKFAIELKQAKRQKVIGAMNILQSTAQAIMGIWAQVPKFDFGVSAGLLTGIVGAIGAIQLATVLKAPLPTRGAEEGYYPNLVRREQDNKLFKTTGTSKMKTGLFTKPRLLVGEGPGDMPEMVIDKKAFAQISPETKSAVLREISAVKGFENGYYQKGTFYTAPRSNTPQGSNDDVLSLLKMALAVVAQNTEVMKDIKENGLQAFVSNKDKKSMKNLKKGIKEYEELISKSKV